MGPADPILGLNQKFLADEDSSKVSVGVGAYRTDEGKPWTLPSVQEAALAIINGNEEYP